jgi:hypothetical protein
MKGNSFRPGAAATRAEAVAIMVNIVPGTAKRKRGRPGDINHARVVIY